MNSSELGTKRLRKRKRKSYKPLVTQGNRIWTTKIHTSTIDSETWKEVQELKQDQTISRLSYVYSVHPYDNIKQSGHMCHRRISISLNTFYTCILDRYLKRWLYFQVQHTLSISANPVQGILPQ